MSWLSYLTLSIGLSAVVAALAVCAAALGLRGADAELLSTVAASLQQARRRFGKAWGWRGELPVVAQCGREGRKGAKRLQRIELRALRPTSTHEVILATRRDWPKWLDKLPASEPAESAFDEIFELRGRHGTRLEGWPNAAARRAVLALLSPEEPAEGDSPYRRGRGQRARTKVAELCVFGAGDGVGLRWVGTSPDGAVVEQAQQALEQLVGLPLEVQRPVALPKRTGSWSLALGGLFWAVTLLTVIGHQCAFLEGVSGRVVEPDTSWLGNDSRLIIATEQGDRPIWVPSDAYQVCLSGPFVRERLAATVHCGGEARVHWAMVGQIPMILLMWLTLSMGALTLSSTQYERRHRRAAAPA